MKDESPIKELSKENIAEIYDEVKDIGPL